MKVDDFLSKPVPGQMTVEEVIQEVENEEQYVMSGSPDGVAVYYSWHPKRLYRLGLYDPNHPLEAQDVEWTECPSVTTVLGVLDKSGALSWWAQGVACEGVLELTKRGLILYGDGYWSDSFGEPVGKDEVVKLLVSERLSINHVTSEAQNRGTSVHTALETWTGNTSFRPTPDVYPEAERGYMLGLRSFLDDLGEIEDIESEVMVGSIEHGYAGRYDLRLTVPTAREMVTKIYPSRKPKVTEIPAGKYLLDLKSSKRVYDTHSLQLAAYELASVECGYGPTDYRAVVHVTDDGRYELVQTKATGEDFLSILQAAKTMSRSKGWL